MSDPGIYVHFAFCKRKCLYCDFNSVAGGEAQKRDYLRALQSETGTLPAGPASTVYFGGGTPTVYSPSELARILDAVRGRFALPPDAEITLEANPGTVSAEDLRALRRAGFSRLSLGVQSLRDDELQLLGRIHSADDARRTVSDAREAGFENLSVDLIRGLPGQELQDWQETVEGAVALKPDHISAYGLILEEGTELCARVDRGDMPEPVGSGDPEWVEWTAGRFEQAGYERYEISNYALPGRQSRHNMNYWLNGEYFGIGAGAWSYLNRERRRNVEAIGEYIHDTLAGEPLTVQSERLSDQAALGEAIMLGLRIVSGVSVHDLSDTYGIDVAKHYERTIEKLVKAGLMVDDATHLRLTFTGLLVQSAIAVEFLA